MRLVIIALALSPGLELLAEHKIETRKPDFPLVMVDQAASSIFPDSWLKAPIRAKAELLEESQRQRARDIVARALAKYPAKVLQDHLRKVQVVGRLEYFGVATGGTNSRNAVYLAVKKSYSDDAIERVFHAEFSSILLRNRARDFDEAAWQRINPADFHYRGNGVQAIKKGEASQKLEASLNEQGFLIEYSSSSLENDFNSFADRLFNGGASFWQIVDQHPKIRAKAELVIAFYAKLDASFTKAWFQSLAGEKK